MALATHTTQNEDRQVTQTFMAKCPRCAKVARMQGTIGATVGDTKRVELHLTTGETTFAWPAKGTMYAWVITQCCKGKRTHAKLVQAKVADHRCDGRCTTAKSHKCSCECGGLNHGISYVSVGSWWA